MPISRRFDAAAINALVNDPEIRPHIGGDGVSCIDVTPVIASRDNWFLLGEHGGFSYVWTAPRTFEVHTFIRPEGRGAWAVEAAQRGLDIMRDEAGAEVVWTRVRTRHVAMFTRRMGFAFHARQTLDLGAGPEVWDIYERRLQCH